MGGFNALNPAVNVSFTKVNLSVNFTRFNGLLTFRLRIVKEPLTVATRANENDGHASAR